MIVVEESAASFFAALGHFHTLGVGEINVRPAISIIVNKCHSTTHGFHDEFLLRAGKVLEMHAGGAGDVRNLG
jgi:hypothetical protein